MVMGTMVVLQEIHGNGSEMCGNTSVLQMNVAEINHDNGMTIAELPQKQWLSSAVMTPSSILLTYQLQSTLCCRV